MKIIITDDNGEVLDKVEKSDDEIARMNVADTFEFSSNAADMINDEVVALKRRLKKARSKE